MIRHFSIRSFLFILLMLAGVAGCQEELDQIPQTQISDASFWKNTSDLTQACNYLYTFLPGLGTSDPTGNPMPYQDNYSEDANGTGAAVSNGSRIAPANSGEWTNYYRLIRAANNILEKSATVTGDTAQINRYLGEARFFRGMGYFELVKRFGDVPLITQTLSLSDTLLYASRTNRQVVLETVYADLDYASIHCPKPSALATAEYGRITSTAAQAFKARVALFAGTWDKYHGGGNPTKHLQLAVNASNAVINSGSHALFTATGDSSYYYLFQYQNIATQTNYTYASNRETILDRLYGQNQVNNIVSHQYVRSGLEQGGIKPTKAFVDSYLFKDGLPKGKSKFDSLANQTNSLTEFSNRDPRMGMTVFNKTQLYPTINGNYLYKPALTYRTRKYFITPDWVLNISFVNFHIIRYAEVLLTNAEAKYELNGTISDADLNTTINAIRRRATNNNNDKLPLLTNAFVQSNGLNMLTEIRRERQIELGMEGFHYWDILRWKTAETVLLSSVLGAKYFPAEMTPASANTMLTTDKFLIIEDASRRKFDPQKDYLWPLPTRELALNPKLTQNPGW